MSLSFSLALLSLACALIPTLMLAGVVELICWFVDRK